MYKILQDFPIYSSDPGWGADWFETLESLLIKQINPTTLGRKRFIFCVQLGLNYLSRAGIKIGLTGENVRPNFREYDYAVGFDYLDNPNYYRLPNYVRIFWKEDSKINPRGANKEDLQNRNFCAFLYSNQHNSSITYPNQQKLMLETKTRDNFFHLLSKYKKVNSGGKALNNTGYQIAKGYETAKKFFSQHKFVIAFENSSYPGYTTEKLYNALQANTVPIYWGNPLAGKDFNPKAFINAHDFADFDALTEYVKKVDLDDDLYLSYLNQPMFEDGQGNKFTDKNSFISFLQYIIENGEQPHKEHHLISLSKYAYFKLLNIWRRIFRKIRGLLKKRYD